MPGKRKSFSALRTVYPDSDFNLVLDLAIGSVQALHEFYMACNFEVVSYDTLDVFLADLTEQFNPIEQSGRPKFLNNVLVRIPENGPIDTCCFVDFEKNSIIMLQSSNDTMQTLQVVGLSCKPKKMNVLQFKGGRRIDEEKYAEVSKLVLNKSSDLHLSEEDIAKLTKYLCSIDRPMHGDVRPGNIWCDRESLEVIFTQLCNNLSKNPDYSSYYSPPRALSLRGKKADIYSLGKVFLEMFTCDLQEEKREWTEIYVNDTPIKIQAERDGCGGSQGVVNKRVRNRDSLWGILRNDIWQKFRIIRIREDVFGSIIDTIISLIIDVKDIKVADSRKFLFDAKERLEQAKKTYNDYRLSRQYGQAGGLPANILSENEQGAEELINQVVFRQQDYVFPQPGIWQKFASKWKSTPLGYKIITAIIIMAGIGAIVYGCVFCPPIAVLLPIIGSLNAPAIAIFGGAILVGITTIAHSIHIACAKMNKSSTPVTKKLSRRQLIGSTRRRLDFFPPQEGKWQKLVSKWKTVPLGYKILAVMAIAVGVGAIVYGCVFCPPMAVVALPFVGTISASAIATFGGAAVVGVTVVAHATHVACTKSVQSNISETGDSAVAAGVAPPNSSTDIIPVSKEPKQAAATENITDIRQAREFSTPLYSQHSQRRQHAVIAGEAPETPIRCAADMLPPKQQIKGDEEAGQAVFAAAETVERPSTPLNLRRGLQGSKQASIDSAQAGVHVSNPQDSVTAALQRNKRHSCPPNFCSDAFFSKDGAVPPGMPRNTAEKASNTPRNTAEKASNTPKWGTSEGSDSLSKTPLLSASGSSQPEQDLSESTCSIL